MILRRTRGARTHAAIGRAVDGFTKHFLLEPDVGADDGGRQVILHTLEQRQHGVEIAVAPCHDNLDRAEQFLRQQIEVFSP